MKHEWAITHSCLVHCNLIIIGRSSCDGARTKAPKKQLRECPRKFAEISASCLYKLDSSDVSLSQISATNPPGCPQTDFSLPYADNRERPNRGSFFLSLIFTDTFFIFFFFSCLFASVGLKIYFFKKLCKNFAFVNFHFILTRESVALSQHSSPWFVIQLVSIQFSPQLPHWFMQIRLNEMSLYPERRNIHSVDNYFA